VHLLNCAIYCRHILASTYSLYMHINSATSGSACMYCRVGKIHGVMLSITLDGTLWNCFYGPVCVCVERDNGCHICC
jgi:hypothetical protein